MKLNTFSILAPRSRIGRYPTITATFLVSNNDGSPGNAEAVDKALRALNKLTADDLIDDYSLRLKARGRGAM